MTYGHDACRGHTSTTSDVCFFSIFFSIWKGRHHRLGFDESFGARSRRGVVRLRRLRRGGDGVGGGGGVAVVVALRLVQGLRLRFGGGFLALRQRGDGLRTLRRRGVTVRLCVLFFYAVSSQVCAPRVFFFLFLLVSFRFPPPFFSPNNN